MTPRRWMLGLALLSVLLMSGCRHCCRHSAPPGPTGGPPGPIGGNPNLPPQNIPLDPPPRTGMKPELLLPTSPPGSSSHLPPTSRGQVILGEPELEPKIEEKTEPKKETKATAPPATAQVEESNVWPVGIAGFAQVKDGVSNGLRPDLDGLDWLQGKGYKTVLFLRSGKEDDSSDRKQIEKRGLKYQSLTVTAETINPELVMDFNGVVNNADGRPIFVYDLDGKRAGAMWYLYFRTSEMAKDDEARIRAGRFGLKEKGDDEQTQLWTGVQKYLKDQVP